MEISVLTLNCWSIPVISKDIKVRIEHIGKLLATGQFDIAVLQEVWTMESYHTLVRLAGSVMKYTHYFHSGLLGSGCCIFSKHTIMSALIHRYSLNGYPYKLQHMDWYGGKAIGLCQLDINGLIVNVYGSHLHAQYCHTDEDYKAHRLMQAYEMGEFIYQTQYSCDLAIACGDLNMKPTDLGYKVILQRAGLKDAWLEVNGEEGESAMTCDRPDNMYWLNNFDPIIPYGQRIDHILYRAVSDCEVEVKQSELGPRTFQPTSGGRAIPYSDHEIVIAKLSVNKHETNNIVKKDAVHQLNLKTLENVREIVRLGVKDVRQTFIYSLAAMFIIFILICVLICFDPLACILPPSLLSGGYIFMQVSCGIALVFVYWNLLVMCPSESNALQGCMADIERQINLHYP